MKRALFFLFLGVFVLLIISPNLNAIEKPVYKVPTVKEDAAVITNDDLLLKTCKSKARICLDPARGGDDKGYLAEDNLYEKDLNLSLAKALGAKLEQAGYEVVYTRQNDSVDEYDSEDVACAARVQMAKDMKADYLISIELSSSNNSLIQGFCLFTQPDDQVTDLSKAIAERLSRINFAQFQGIDNDHYSNFPMLYDRSLPSIIINFGYITNIQDLEKLTAAEYQDKIGEAVTAAFLESVN